MNSNRTFTMLKPDSVEQGNMLPILNMIENAGFKIIALKYKRMNREEAESFYSIHSDKPFFNDLVAFMTSGPIVAAVLTKENAVSDFRKFTRILFASGRVGACYNLPESHLEALWNLNKLLSN